MGQSGDVRVPGRQLHNSGGDPLEFDRDFRAFKRQFRNVGPNCLESDRSLRRYQGESDFGRFHGAHKSGRRVYLRDQGAPEREAGGAVHKPEIRNGS